MPRFASWSVFPAKPARVWGKPSEGSKTPCFRLHFHEPGTIHQAARLLAAGYRRGATSA